MAKRARPTRVGDLCVELRQLITEFLAVADIGRLRRVSTSWRLLDMTAGPTLMARGTLAKQKWCQRARQTPRLRVRWRDVHLVRNNPDMQDLAGFAEAELRSLKLHTCTGLHLQWLAAHCPRMQKLQVFAFRGMDLARTCPQVTTLVVWAHFRQWSLFPHIEELSMFIWNTPTDLLSLRHLRRLTLGVVRFNSCVDLQPLQTLPNLTHVNVQLNPTCTLTPQSYRGWHPRVQLTVK